MKRLLTLSLMCLLSGQAFCASKEEMRYAYAQHARNYRSPFATVTDKTDCQKEFSGEQRETCEEAQSFWKKLKELHVHAFLHNKYKNNGDTSDNTGNKVIPSIDYFARQRCHELPKKQQLACKNVQSALKETLETMMSEDTDAFVDEFKHTRQVTKDLDHTSIHLKDFLGFSKAYAHYPNKIDWNSFFIAEGYRYGARPLRDGSYSAVANGYLTEDYRVSNQALRARVIAGHFQATQEDNDYPKKPWCGTSSYFPTDTDSQA